MPITRRTLTVDEIADDLDAIHNDVQSKIHDEWDWMKAAFYVDCLRALAHDRTESGGVYLNATERELIKRLVAGYHTGPAGAAALRTLRGE